MDEDTHNEAEQAPPESASPSSRNPSGASEPSASEDELQEAVSQIPGLDAVRTVTQQVTVNIGVLTGSIRGSAVHAAGQASRSGLGEAIAQAGVTHWQVQAEELHRVQQVFVPVPSVVEPATKILESRHVVLLQGRAHWGKSTTAQWLLTHLHHDRVFVVDTADNRSLSEISDALNGDGYVLDTLPSNHAMQLRSATLLRLSEHLQSPDRLGHLVITVDALTSLPAELADYLVVCQQVPDADDVLWRHLAGALGDDDATEALSCAKEWIRERLRNVPSPGRMRDLAAALAAMIHHGGQKEVAERDYQQRILAYVGEWFREHPNLRERCFMTAGAVLNGASYQDVADAASELERLVDGEAAGDGPIPRGWSPSSSRVKRVESIGARLQKPEYGSADGPLAVVELEEPLVQAMVLAHLWYEHDDIFDHLFAWLDDLARNSPFEVSGRAAAAAGTLCAIDFHYLLDRLLRPWATDQTTMATHASQRDRTARISAAVALTTAAREPTLKSDVLSLLQQWSGPGSPTGLPWTAATAFGMLDPEHFLSDALQGLRTTTEHHHTMSSVVAHGLANLCEVGYTRAALEALTDWLYEPSPPLVARACNVFDRLTRLWVEHPDGLRVPVLLTLTEKNAAYAVRMRWYDLLNCGRPDLEAAALWALHRWLLLADDDERCHQAISAMLHPLLDDRTTRRGTRNALQRCAFEFERSPWTATHLLKTKGKPLDILFDWIWRTWQPWFTQHRG